MKNLIKTNYKLFIGIFIGIIISGITVYAITASDIDYKDTKVDQALDDLYIKSQRDLSLINEHNECYSSGYTLTKTYTATEKSIVSVSILCGAYADGTSKSTLTSNCNLTSTGTLLNATELTHVNGGFVYEKTASYQLQKDQTITINVKSGTDRYWYAGYDISTIK